MRTRLPIKARVAMPGMISRRDGDTVEVQAQVTGGPSDARGRIVLVTISNDALRTLLDGPQPRKGGSGGGG